MDDYDDLTVHEARELFFERNGFPPGGGYRDRWFAVKLGPVTVNIYNFNWRARAVPFHDIHHILTGYAATPAGEIQVGTWELAAGPFPHYFAALMNFPSIFVGALLLPRRAFEAFCLGRRSATLYAVALTDELLETRVAVMRKRLLPDAAPDPSPGDRVAFGVMAALSLTWLLSPVLAGILVYGWIQ